MRFPVAAYVCMAATVLCALPALAQYAPSSLPPKSTSIPTVQGVPLSAPIPAPMINDIPGQGAFPTTIPSTPPPIQIAPQQIPQVDLCKINSLRGIWRFVQVFENPPGTKSADLQNNPYQYRQFGKDGLLMEQIGGEAFNKLEVLRRTMTQNAKSAGRQYVLTDKGVLYLYKNRVATDTYYCGIVLNDQDPYKKGDMILTPVNKRGAQVYEIHRRQFLKQRRKNGKVGRPIMKGETGLGTNPVPTVPNFQLPQIQK